MASPSLTVVPIDSPLLPDDPSPERRLHFAVAVDDPAEPFSPVRISVGSKPNAAFRKSFSIMVESNVGRAVNALPATGPYHQWDNEAYLQVIMLEGRLYTRPDEDVYNGHNWLWVSNGNKGQGEVIAFANAQLYGNNKYVLTRLLRGRRGTEDQMAGHGSGDKVVPLDGFVFSKEYDLSWHRRNSYFRVVSQEEDDPISVPVVGPVYPTSRPLMPFSPVYIRGSRDGSNNLTITWLRRSRQYFNLFDLDSAAPMGAPSEKYKVEILDGSSNVLRTINVTTNSTTYSAANQTTDLLTPGAPVHVRITQVNSDLSGSGLGVPAIATV